MSLTIKKAKMQSMKENNPYSSNQKSWMMTSYLPILELELFFSFFYQPTREAFLIIFCHSHENSS